jgi:hypothetical protein
MDASYEAQKEREFQRITGTGNSGIAIRVDAMRASFDPILGQYRPPSPAGRVQHPGSAASSVPASPVRGSSAAGSETGPQAPPALPQERTATPGRRSRAAQGETWGTYNPLTHSWATPPRDARFQDQAQVMTRKAGISGMMSKPNTAVNQGIYNPILNTWTVPPQNLRHIQGLAFAPAALFKQPTPTTVRPL